MKCEFNFYSANQKNRDGRSLNQQIKKNPGLSLTNIYLDRCEALYSSAMECDKNLLLIIIELSPCNDTN